MNRHVLISAALWYSLLIATPSPASEVADLAWMQGQWQSGQSEQWNEEHWMAPREGLMLGVNRSAHGKGKLAFEFLRIQADADGTPVYWASPGGSPAVPFRMDRLGANSVSFINPDHDYPAKIHYRREGDQLTATISALDGSNPMAFEWSLTQ